VCSVCSVLFVPEPRALVVLVLHPKAPHVRLHAGAGDKLGAVPGVHAFIDAVFWDAHIYPCHTNTQANADFQRFFLTQPTEQHNSFTRT
jgi:hypothetical protein